MSLNFEALTELEIGDHITECGYGQEDRYEIISLPTVKTTDCGMTQVSFQGENLETEEVINFLTTKNMEHYGPDLYLE